MNIRNTDPEFVGIFDRFAHDEVVNEPGAGLDAPMRYLAILASLIGCGGVDAFREVLPDAVKNGVTPVMVRECVYQSTDYLGYGRMLPFLKVMNEYFESTGMTLPARSTVDDKH